MLQNINCGTRTKAAPKNLGAHLNLQDLQSWRDMLLDVIEAIRDDIAHSRVILRESLQQQQDAWKREVLIRIALNPVAHEEPSMGASVTSGVPNALRQLTEMANILHANDQPDDQDEQQFLADHQMFCTQAVEEHAIEGE
ncbi:hypothetical protein FRC08_014465 [Ceratobasidium sp. 394]|nr:hypothetical protein FRC08_014465 [Ceratobasidium sp. 394]KAG9075266.1 hypothetical protein FS749_013085 [Ceratobasidium sp. UAMH 11750]